MANPEGNTGISSNVEINNPNLNLSKMRSLVYLLGTRGINFHILQWFEIPKAFTALLFKPLLRHTITIPNCLAGTWPTVYINIILSLLQSSIFPVLQNISALSQLLKEEIMHYMANCFWLLGSRGA